MKFFFMFFISCLVSRVFSQCNVYLDGSTSSPLNTPGWSLIFEDQFNGTSLGSHWQLSGGIEGCGANNPNNISVYGGQLELTGNNSDWDGHAWSGAQIEYWQFNRDIYVEINAKNPTYSPGVWPSFWFWGCSAGQYQEIDFFEYDQTLNPFATNLYRNTVSCASVTDADKCQTTVYPNSNGSPVDLSQAFHRYGCEWTSGYIKFYIDDHLIRTIMPGGVSIPQNPMLLILSFQIRDVNNCTPSGLPKTVFIDYVKIYNKNNTALFHNIKPPSQVCKGSNFWTDVAKYPNATYQWSSSYFNFSNPLENGTYVNVNSTTTSNQSYPISVTATFPSGYVETKTFNVLVVEGAPPTPGTISKVRIGTSCYYQARVFSNPNVWEYQWKLGNGAWLIGDPCGSYNCYPVELMPNSTYNFQVKAKYVCNIFSPIKSGTIIVGDPPPNCVWKQTELEEDSSMLSNEITVFPNPADEHVTISCKHSSALNQQISIFDLSGNIVYQLNVENNVPYGKIEIETLIFKTGF